jgi:hypothetical protein
MPLLVHSFPSPGLFPGRRIFPSSGHVTVGQGHVIAISLLVGRTAVSSILSTRPVGVSTVTLKTGTSTITPVESDP